jgi:hypothetical protein
MTISASTLKLLLDAGLQGDALVRVVESIEADMAPKRSSGAARQARYRARHAASRVTERDDSDVTRDVTGDVTGDVTRDVTAKEKAPTPPKENNTPPHSPSGNVPPSAETKPALIAELGRVLDAEHAQAVFTHRQKIKKPLTARAAKLLAQKFAQCADPNAAADAMIANGWQGFEPEWLERRGHAPPASGWRKNGVGYYLKPGSEPFEAHKMKAKQENSQRYWDFVAAEKSGSEVLVPTLWPGGAK